MPLPIAGLGLRAGVSAVSAALPSGAGPRGFSINVETDIREAQRMLKRVGERNVPLALAQSLTKTVVHLRKVQRRTLPKHIDRPTPWTRDGILFQRAEVRDYKRGTMFASVFVKPDRESYLKYQVYGGRRLPKRRAVVVPGSQTKLNKFGNLAGMKTFISKELGKPNTFTGTINGQAGLWRRMKSGRTKLLVLFADSANYTGGRWPFFRISERIVARELPKQLNRAVKRALRR